MLMIAWNGKNVEIGMHLMDKVRNSENLDTALRRVLREELQVADDCVGARIWGIEFDRDRDGFLTPRLKNKYLRAWRDSKTTQSEPRLGFN